ncbi:hypothetical protein [Gluconobacter sphaericus]|uniref:Uncharacterized protein n=1 Tax=Gluconobacter sphaericus NBRC 12467 TaxID=1307951 RepID=A0AA37SJ34_9PROT|nr:hypothetical protein [Gluconobacter sphaericus]MBF0885522.1 hypothetical protein [Gluconobacter sphaericus]GBR56465.1 hypothetical protein AA12467_2625 [Gluconobacter sphaericus NBRC 12467]GEB42759.1 hypothetical protein GSP01_15410 [Gluconobacter sphaericus NBRC 12467]GLQ84735.1 hypothetical protein GCM10007872_16430 [Gluconobacter sphaericus NBRC 12467]GLQ85110.1 hypothetical protein GCM10007872_20180 [Gluconobacter sphaericus NBRC 12467]
MTGFPIELNKGDFVYIKNEKKTFSSDVYGVEGTISKIERMDKNTLYPNFNYFSNGDYKEYEGFILTINTLGGDEFTGHSVDVLPINNNRTKFRSDAKRIWDKLPIADQDISTLFKSKIERDWIDDHNTMHNAMRYLRERELIRIENGIVEKDVSFDPFPED